MCVWVRQPPTRRHTLHAFRSDPTLEAVSRVTSIGVVFFAPVTTPPPCNDPSRAIF